MGDKEVLAQLKTAYESLQDIVDNAEDIQIENGRNDLINAQNLLIDIYSYLWKTTEEDLKIQGEEDLTIGKEVYSDYYDVGNEEFILKADIIKNGKEYIWWEDYDFILK